MTRTSGRDSIEQGIANAKHLGLEGAALEAEVARLERNRRFRERKDADREGLTAEDLQAEGFAKTPERLAELQAVAEAEAQARVAYEGTARTLISETADLDPQAMLEHVAGVCGDMDRVQLAGLIYNLSELAPRRQKALQVAVQGHLNILHTRETIKRMGIDRAELEQLLKVEGIASGEAVGKPGAGG